jgi:hypothetical protein
MVGKPQFSLAFLFSELFYVAVALGLERVIWMLNQKLRIGNLARRGDFGLLVGLMLLVAIASAGAAIGNCFGRPGRGAWIALAIFFVSPLVLPFEARRFVLDLLISGPNAAR